MPGSHAVNQEDEDTDSVIFRKFSTMHQMIARPMGACLLLGCLTTYLPGVHGEETNMLYLVKRCHALATGASTGKPPVARKPMEADWNAPMWQGVEPLELTHFMGKRPEHFPRTQARLCYDDQTLHVIFRVEDRYVRAIARKNQDPVCRDSCAEFFFFPNRGLPTAYFNLEMNCGGTMLMHYQTVPREAPIKFSAEDFERIEVAHSLPKNVDPEETSPTVWTIAYRLPFDVIEKYEPSAIRPAPGVLWRANFYKCADRTSHPHWLTWAPVDHPSPNFHLPEHFGTLKFE